MFKWLTGSKKKKDEDYFQELMQASVVGSRRSKVKEALATKSIKIGNEDDVLHCAHSVAAIVRIVSKQAGLNEPFDNNDVRFVAGLFAFVASNHLSRMYSVEFEFVSSIACLELFGTERADEIGSLGRSYNQMSAEGKVVEAIGSTLARWIDRPTDENLVSMAKLFTLCLEHAEKSK